MFHGNANEVLVIVHLSSIDNYVDYYDIDAAIQFVTDLKMAIVKAGPQQQTVIMDQGWTEITADAKVLRDSVAALSSYYPVTLFHHDELCDVRPWQDGMRDLAKLLRSLSVSRVRLGGLWSSDNGETGCVHETQRQLRARGIPCYIDTSLVAMEENDHRCFALKR